MQGYSVAAYGALAKIIVMSYVLTIMTGGDRESACRSCQVTWAGVEWQKLSSEVAAQLVLDACVTSAVTYETLAEGCTAILWVKRSKGCQQTQMP